MSETPRETTTTPADDLHHLREVHRLGGPVHPFTAMRFVALGWWAQESKGCAFVGIGGSYGLTAAGRAALREANAHA